MSTIYQLSYISRPSAGVTANEVQEILEVARTTNAKLSVTGMLLYRHDLFIQILEGERQALTDLFAKIHSDDRHEQIMLVGMAPAERRMFSEWSMGYLSLSGTKREALQRYFPDEPNFREIDHGALASLARDLASDSRAA